MKKARSMSMTMGIVILGAFLMVSMSSPGNLWAKTIELSFALHTPPKASPFVNAFKPWAEEIETRANGKLKIKFYHSQSLVKARDAYKAVKAGIADITWIAFGLNRGRFPLSSVMELPFLSPDTYTGSHALADLYKKFPEMRAEVKDVHLLNLWVSLPYEIHTVTKPVKELADIKGMKLATQPAASSAVSAVGAIPVTSSVPEIYTMLEKGVADGTALAWGAFNAFKLYEVTKYHINPSLGGVPYCHIMNSARWKGLPDELKAIITEVTQNMLPDALCQAVTNDANVGIKKAKERGDEIIDLTPEQQQQWIAVASSDWDAWATEMEKKGLPGKVVLEEAIKLVEKHRNYRNKQ